MFKYEEYDVEKKLSCFIKKLWILDNSASASDVSGKSVLPNGCFNIAVIKGNGLTVEHQGREQHLTQGTYFCGQMTEAISVTVRSGAKATMIQLHAWTPVHFSSVDMYQFHDQIVHFELSGIDLDVMGKLPGQSNQKICQNISLIFEPHLVTNLNTRLISMATTILLNNKGYYAIEKLAQDLKCSSRYLQKMFKKHVGLTPKQFALILKLRSTVDEIAYPQQDQSSFVNLAVDNHFYDQAHFNNTFKSIVKTSPKNFKVLDYFLSLKR
ncbi:helix-turn-helix domain-containing protein [Pedobacter aquatilis]|uniref:helix-turn-helix domain-containing protein n=1 Tax=Pedobacter aquatilis TaxID=351343 RepID=UPI00292E90AC|nr:helix-turn-helix domain-containing protein [Pedobacter aquatilis]